MRRLLGFLLLLSMCWPSAHAAPTHVNPKNGDFYITYADEPGDVITRTYNSKSTIRGWFGFGWGSTLEGRLFILGPESAAYVANGSGRTFYFGPANGEDPSSKAIELIVADRTASERLDAYQVAELRAKLAEEEAQVDVVRKYGMNAQLREGTRLQSRACPDQTVSREGGTYVVQLCDGQRSYFNDRGVIVKSILSDGRVLTAHYESGPYPDAIEDSAGHVVHLEWNLAGQIVRLTGKSDSGKPLAVTYRYDERGDLVESQADAGNPYRYTYVGNHDMSEIRYVDDSAMRITYDENSYATSVVDRNGDSARYDYWTDPKTGDNWTRITRTDEGSPVKAMTLGWTKDGRPRRMENGSGEWAEYQYEGASNHVTHVRSENDERTFKYDARGDVVFVQEQRTGNIAWLDYNDQRQISRVRQWDGEQRKTTALSFRYGPLGKPVEIRSDDGAVVTVEYDSGGEIKSVKSDRGARAALALTMGFQQLLALVHVPQP